MKKFWRKALRLVTLATVIPVNVTHDEHTGKTTYQSLLASLSVGPSQDGIHTDVGLNIGEGVLTGAVRTLIDAQKEAAMYADYELDPISPVAPAPADESVETEVPDTDTDQAEL